MKILANFIGEVLPHSLPQVFLPTKAPHRSPGRGLFLYLSV